MWQQRVVDHDNKFEICYSTSSSIETTTSCAETGDQTKQQILNMEQSKEQMLQQLCELRQQLNHVEQNYHVMKQLKENAEQQLDAMRQQKEEVEKQLFVMKQEKQEKDKQLHNMRQQEEQNGLTLDVLQQKDPFLQQLRIQASRAEERARLVELQLRLLRQQAESQLADQISRLSARHICTKPEDMKSSWMVDSSEIQVMKEKPLGVGGWSEVKVAMFRGIKVAAKLLHESIVSPHNIDLFIREMNMASSVRHPNLLLFMGASFLENYKPIIITELMPTNLRSIVQALSHDQIIAIGMDVACGLNYLHLMKPVPIIHRDISSANVLLEPIGLGLWRAKVSDFGSANFVSKVLTIGPGNASYAAPESSNAKLQSTKMDVYSYGVLLLEMATAQFPEPLLRTIQLQTLLWREMAEIVRVCTCEDPANRPDMKDILLSLPLSGAQRF